MKGGVLEKTLKPNFGAPKKGHDIESIQPVEDSMHKIDQPLLSHDFIRGK